MQTEGRYEPPVGEQTFSGQPKPENRVEQNSIGAELGELAKQSQEITAKYKEAFGLPTNESADAMRGYLRLMTGDPRGKFVREVDGANGEKVQQQVDLLNDPAQAPFREKMAAMMQAPESAAIRKVISGFETAMANGAFPEANKETYLQYIQNVLLNPRTIDNGKLSYIDGLSRTQMVKKRVALQTEFGAAVLSPSMQAEYQNITNLMSQRQIDVVGDTRHQLSMIADLRDTGLTKAFPGFSAEQAVSLRQSLDNIQSDQPDNGQFTAIARAATLARESYRKGLVNAGQYKNLLMRSLEAARVSNTGRAEAPPQAQQPQAERPAARPEQEPNQRIAEIDALLSSKAEAESSEPRKSLTEVITELNSSDQTFQAAKEQLNTRMSADDLRTIASFYAGSGDPKDPMAQATMNKETITYYENNNLPVIIFKALERGIQIGLLDPKVRAAFAKEIAGNRLTGEDLNVIASRLAEKIAKHQMGLMDESREKLEKGNPSFLFAQFDSRGDRDANKKFDKIQTDLANAAKMSSRDKRAPYQALEQALQSDRSCLDLVDDLGQIGILFSNKDLAKVQRYGDSTYPQNNVRDIYFGLETVRTNNTNKNPNPERTQFYDTALKLRSAYVKGLIPTRARYRELLTEAAQTTLSK